MLSVSSQFFVNKMGKNGNPTKFFPAVLLRFGQDPEQPVNLNLSVYKRSCWYEIKLLRV